MMQQETKNRIKMRNGRIILIDDTPKRRKKGRSVTEKIDSIGKETLKS